jgi:hypothetical protein
MSGAGWTVLGSAVAGLLVVAAAVFRQSGQISADERANCPAVIDGVAHCRCGER